MAQKSASGNKRTIASIDGFAEPSAPTNDRDQGGNNQPSAGDQKPEGPIERAESSPGIDTISVFDIADAGAGGDGYSGGRKRRGRPIGSRNATKTQAENLVGNIEALLVSIHFGVATMLSVPELEIDPSEAKAMSELVSEAQRLYPLAISEKKIFWSKVCVTLGTIYGSRAVAIAKKPVKKKEPILMPTPTPRAPGTQPAPSQPGVSATPAVAQSQLITHPSQVWNEGVEDISVL